MLKMDSIGACMLNVKEAMHKLKSVALCSCWKKFWPGGLNNFWRFSKQQDE
jgi:hypothetical protein